MYSLRKLCKTNIYEEGGDNLVLCTHTGEMFVRTRTLVLTSVDHQLSKTKNHCVCVLWPPIDLEVYIIWELAVVNIHPLELSQPCVNSNICAFPDITEATKEGEALPMYHHALKVGIKGLDYICP